MWTLRRILHISCRPHSNLKFSCLYTKYQLAISKGQSEKYIGEDENDMINCDDHISHDYLSVYITNCNIWDTRGQDLNRIWPGLQSQIWFKSFLRVSQILRSCTIHNLFSPLFTVSMFVYFMWIKYYQILENAKIWSK